MLVETDESETINENEESQSDYKPYEEYVDQLVGEEVLAAVDKSMKYIYDQLRTPSPLFEGWLSTKFFYPSEHIQRRNHSLRFFVFQNNLLVLQLEFYCFSPLFSGNSLLLFGYTESKIHFPA